MFEAFKEAQKKCPESSRNAAQARPGRGPGASRTRPRRVQAAAQARPGRTPARGQAAPQRVARPRPSAPGGPSSGFDPERARRFLKPS